MYFDHIVLRAVPIIPMIVQRLIENDAMETADRLLALYTSEPCNLLQYHPSRFAIVRDTLAYFYPTLQRDKPSLIVRLLSTLDLSKVPLPPDPKPVSYALRAALLCQAKPTECGCSTPLPSQTRRMWVHRFPFWISLRAGIPAPIWTQCLQGSAALPTSCDWTPRHRSPARSSGSRSGWWRARTT